MAGGALIAVALLARAIRRAHAAGDLNASSALTLGMGWLISLPLAVVASSGALTRRTDAFGQLVTVFPAWYPAADSVGLFVTAVLAVALLIRRLASGRVPVHAAGLLAIALLVVTHLSSGLHGGRVVSPRGVVLLSCLMAATVLPRGRGAALGAGIFGVTLAIASGGLAVLRHDAAFVIPCRDACGGLGLSGLLPNEDLLGIVLSAAIPFAYLGFRGPARNWLILYLAGMAAATGSQTATIAAAVAVLALVSVRPRLDGDRVTPGRSAIAGLVLASGVVGSVYIPLRHWDPSALTDRGLLWGVASKYIHASPWLGYGQDKWSSLYGTSEIFQAAQRSAHNQWMDVVFTAGALGAALLVGVVVATLWSAGFARPGVTLTVATLALIGTTEGVWAVGTFDLLSFSLVALILTGATGDGEMHRRVRDRATGHRRLRPPGRGVRRGSHPRGTRVVDGAGHGLCSGDADARHRLETERAPQMDLHQYARVLRMHWVVIAVSILACIGAAAWLAWTRAPIYAAQARLFVSSSGGPTDLSQTYQGGLFVQQRVLSYAQIVSSPPVTQAVIRQLGLTESVSQLQDKIHASVPKDTVLIDITAEDRSPTRAKAIADAVAQHFSTFVNTLETPQGQRRSPVKVTVTSRAEVPTRPVSPKKALSLVLGGVLGLILGLGAALLREALNRRIRSEDHAAAIADAPVLGSIVEDPHADSRPLVVVEHPGSVAAEAYRRLRTNLRALGTDLDVRSFVVSSAGASEGKTLIAANLAIAFAQSGTRVILVDADLRRPALADVLGLPSNVGLSTVLLEDLPIDASLQTWRDGVPLEVLASGWQPAEPNELLESDRFAAVLEALTDRTDLVIVDAPALLPVADAAILARLTAGLLLVASLTSTRTEQLDTAARSLAAVDAQLLGVVLNRLAARKVLRYRSAGPWPDRRMAGRRWEGSVRMPAGREG
jgi:polysaccharide biosynthesis transport protein